MRKSEETERLPVIEISGVKKEYRLGMIGGTTLQEELRSWWARVRRKEDPNLKIGADARVLGQRFMALNGINLKVYRGERLGIIGANGAGKSTLLKLLARVTAPTEGEIDITGRISSMLEIGAGFNDEMTGRENVYMNGSILGMSRREITAKMEDIIAFADIGPFMDTPVKRYSSGMFVKLAFSVAAHLDSEIMIMDEVLAVGDMAFQNKCLERMRESAEQENKTILYVSHNMQTIRRLCSRCVVMNQGKIIFDGDVERAIALYMNMGLGENPVEVDLSSRSYFSRGYDSGISLLGVRLDGKITPVYEPGEDLRLTVSLQTTHAVSHVSLHVSLFSDSDVPVASSMSKPFSIGREGKWTIAASVPLKGFEKGTFYCSIGFFEVNSIGEEEMLDIVRRAFSIEIPGIPSWYINDYGFLRLPEMTMEICEVQPG